MQSLLQMRNIDTEPRPLVLPLSPRDQGMGKA